MFGQPSPSLYAPTGQVPAGGGRSTGRRLLVWGAAIVGVLVVLALIGAALSKRDSEGNLVESADISVDNIRVGDCLDFPDQDEFTSLHAVPCSEPHDAELFFRFGMGPATGYTGGISYPSDDEFQAAITDNCLPAFEAYVGQSYEDALHLDIDWFVPVPEAWTFGDRNVLCVLFDVE